MLKIHIKELKIEISSWNVCLLFKSLKIVIFKVEVKHIDMFASQF